MSTDAPNFIGFGRSIATAVPCDGDVVASERFRARRYPLSRWYLRPMAGWLAAVLTPTRVRPVHLTVCGLMATLAAIAVVTWWPERLPLAAGVVLLYWLFDRADGQLARRQKTVSAWGAWLDGNVDELADVALHVAVAALLAAQVAAPWPWWLLIAFLAGKYLFMYGLSLERKGDEARLRDPADKSEPILLSVLRRAYHLPGNADVRVHLLALGLAANCLAAELACVAVYYNGRWLVRYFLVARRLGGVR